MKVAASVVAARRKSLAALLENHRYLPLAEVCSRLKISEATARRDLRVLERERRVTRTYGGALSSFDATYASFAARRPLNRQAKARIADKALRFIRPGSTCFFDSGTTVFALAEALYRHPVARSARRDQQSARRGNARPLPVLRGALARRTFPAAAVDSPR
jgi:DeoR/GlpR family transcriptional regulator of sugar metabolism